jgi:hypothetical protein
MLVPTAGSRARWPDAINAVNAADLGSAWGRFNAEY